MSLKPILSIVLILIACTGCGPTPPGPAAPPKVFSPIDQAAAVFWVRQATEVGERLRAIADEYNAHRPPEILPIRVEYIGGYSAIFQKVSASIRARVLPSMTVGYQSMTAEYITSGAVVGLDDLIKDPIVGFAESDLADFWPVVLDMDVYPDHGGQIYSFPFCKSVLMMYFNKNVLEQAGISGPPATWDEFIAQCRQIKTATGKFAYAIDVDCSTLSGWIFSMGGDVINDGKTCYDSPEAIRVFELLETLAREELAYRIPPGTYDDETALARDEIAFTFRTSAGRTSVAKLMGENQDKWGMAPIPQADPERPGTVLYGPSICLFNTTEDQRQAAWAFVKHFSSPEISVRWALETGYLPIRKSATTSPKLQAFWKEWPYNRAAFDCLAFARPEPRVAGWQEIRALVENTATEILTGIRSAREAAQSLRRKADAVLATP